MRKKSIAIWLIFLFVLPATYAQNFPQLRFQQLSEKDGLSSNTVLNTIQDKKGFIWFGTINGLNRYDGYRFKTFFHNENDSTSLPNNMISAITAEEDEHFWVSTKNGLAHFNTHTYESKNILHNDRDTASLKDDADIYPYIDENKNIFLPTYEGLYKLNNNFSITEIPQQTASFQFYNETKKYWVGIFKDRKGNLWSRAANRIYLLDKQTKKIKATIIAPFLYHITNMYFDDDNICWLTTWGGNGVHKFNTVTKQFAKVALGHDEGVIAGYITDWTINNKKYIVICTQGFGMYLVDPLTMQYKCYLKDEFDRPLLNTTHVNHAFTDRQNILWLATNDNGVLYVTPSAGLFEVKFIYRNTEDAKQTIIDNRVVKNFYESDNGYWIGKWESGGTFLYAKNWQQQKFWQALYGKNSIYNPTSMSYFTLKWKNNLYFCTDSGLVKMDALTYKTTLLYPPDAKFPPDFRTIIQVNDTLWWIRSHTYGIFVFNAVKQKFINHYQNKDSCNNCLPYSHYEFLLKDKLGTVWVSTEMGLYEYLHATDNFKAYRRNPTDKITFPTNKLSGMAEDAAGNFWIGTAAGMCMFNPITKRVEKNFSENTYISQVFRVCTDDYQNVWFNSQTAIWCWLRKQDKLIKFTSDAGLPRGFEIGVMEKTKDGSIYAGCINALVKFYPDRLMEFTQNATAQITDATIDNKPAIIDYSSEKKLVLLPGKQTFTIDFAVLNYDLAQNNQYFYRLLPHSKEWIENSTGHLSFYNLAPGTYQLEVKGKNKLGDTYTAADMLIIIVKPYWYQTNCFKVLCILALLAAVTGFYRWRLNSVRRQAGFKQKIAETEMQSLRAQMNPHFIFNSLNSIENFIMQNEKRLASDYLNKFARLIRMILDSSRNEVVPIAKDMEALQLYIDLEQLRFNNKFIYKTYVDPALLGGEYRVPSLLIQPYVENAIVHGLAHSEEENLMLTVTAMLQNDTIKYVVQDNGVGRKQAATYNAQNKPQHKSVGLKITEDRINIFNNKILDDGAVKITDLYTNDNNACGTKVEITIKAI
jgi:ligand-binding sensor domain-containing protein